MVKRSIYRFCLTALTGGILLASCQRKLFPYETIHPIEVRAFDSITLERGGVVLFTESQRAKLSEALAMANAAIRDTLFEKVLIAQSIAGVFDWGYGRLNRVLPEHRANPVAFFLSEYRNRGLPLVSQFVGRNDYSSISVTGSTLPCSETINFNVANLDVRTAVYVAGTIIHERLHSFCFQHRSNNVRQEYNLCDFAYHAGHLAIIIALYRANNSQPIKKPPISICKSLIALLQAEKVIK